MRGSAGAAALAKTGTAYFRLSFAKFQGSRAEIVQWRWAETGFHRIFLEMASLGPAKLYFLASVLSEIMNHPE
jgi:hypothetical protein